jgi:hypothetical protein
MRDASLVKKMIVLTLVTLFTLSAALASTNAKGDGESSPDNLLTANQPAQFKHYTIHDGLAANQTYNVLQSRQGFIWIATRQGLRGSALSYWKVIKRPVWGSNLFRPPPRVPTQNPPCLSVPRKVTTSLLRLVGFACLC